LEASLQGAPEYEIIVVDDCSTDGTAEFLDGLGAPYRVLHNRERGNFALNNNRAAAEAQGNIFCCLNNDTELAGEWWRPMLDALERFNDAGCVGNVHRLPHNRRYDHFGICFPAWLTPLHYGQHRASVPRLEGAYSRWGAVTGACLMIRRERFFEVDGFDPSYINGCEDVDLCLRLHRMGYWHYVAHASEIDHHKGASPGRKTHNTTNLARLKKSHGEYLRQHLVPRDARLAARSYLRGAWAAPRKVNAQKFIAALRQLTRRSGSALRKPDCP
jgi:GT2 family glycosyltransferase